MYDIIKLLIDNGANINTPEFEKEGLLHEICIKGLNKIAILLIKNGANINAKNDIDRTPLDCAISFGRDDTAKILIENGAEYDKLCNTVFDKKRTVLINAINAANMNHFKETKYGKKIPPEVLDIMHTHLDSDQILPEKNN